MTLVTIAAKPLVMDGQAPDIDQFLDTIDIAGGVASNPQTRTTEATDGGATLDSIGSFGQDARGEVYILDLADGDVYRLTPE